MAFKYSSGSQVIGDLKAKDDTQRDTQIDFGEDEIGFETSGSLRVKITNDETVFTHTVHISGSTVEGLRIGKGDSDYRQIVFENNGVDSANIHLSNAENLVIMNETNGKQIQFWVDSNGGGFVQAMTIKDDGSIGIGTSSPEATLHVNGSHIGKVTAVSSWPYTVTSTDYMILASGTGSPRSLTLPAVSGQLGRIIIVKDASGDASTNNIEVDGNGDESIDGVRDKLINTNYGFIKLVCGPTEWHVIG